MNALVFMGFAVVTVVIPVGIVAIMVRWLLMSLGSEDEDNESCR